MRTFCIYCPELPERFQRAIQHFSTACPEVEFIRGIHGQTFGIMAARANSVYDGCFIPVPHVGLCLSHYLVWTVCSFIPDDPVLILEDDAEFEPNWREKTDKAMADCPKDWDILLIGNCNASDKPQIKIAGEVFKVEYPFGTHCYVLRKKAVAMLLEWVRDASLKIDTALIMKAYPKLNVYTVLPRIVGQFGTTLFP